MSSDESIQIPPRDDLCLLPSEPTFAPGATRQVNSMKPKTGRGTTARRQPMGALEIPLHGDGHETWELREPVRIWASSRSRVWIPSQSIVTYTRKTYHLEYSRLVHIHQWLNRSPQLVLDRSQFHYELSRRRTAAIARNSLSPAIVTRATRASPTRVWLSSKQALSHPGSAEAERTPSSSKKIFSETACVNHLPKRQGPVEDPGQDIWGKRKVGNRNKTFLVALALA